MFCNRKCQVKYHVDRRRLELKFKAVQYKGGKCEHCGYIGSVASFDFHHLDPSLKSFAISQDPHTRSWKRIQEEIDKCELLCANCHRETEFKKTMHLKLFIPELVEKYKMVDRAGYAPALGD
jgi:hypothetical protein